MTIRVGTWNVQYARGPRNAARRDLLLRQACDVWVLTETHDDLDLSATHTAVASEQRYPRAGGRWTTVWSSLPVIERLPTLDPRRTVAVRLDGGPDGELVIFGTVLPWNGDAGPALDAPARGWDEFRRVAPLQAEEWRFLRRSFPDATLVVAGDLNQDLGGAHYYGFREGRSLLQSGLASAGLQCLTTTDRFSPSVLDHPPIDHVCAGAGVGHVLMMPARVEGWNCDDGGTRLSDHGGTLAHIETRPA